MRASGTVMIPVLLSISAIVLGKCPPRGPEPRIGLDGVGWLPGTFIAMLLFQTTYYRLVLAQQKVRRLI